MEFTISIWIHAPKKQSFNWNVFCSCKIFNWQLHWRYRACSYKEWWLYNQEKQFDNTFWNDRTIWILIYGSKILSWKERLLLKSRVSDWNFDKGGSLCHYRETRVLVWKRTKFLIICGPRTIRSLRQGTKWTISIEFSSMSLELPTETL